MAPVVQRVLDTKLTGFFLFCGADWVGLWLLHGESHPRDHGLLRVGRAES
jgi:hypothetical protein